MPQMMSEIKPGNKVGLELIKKPIAWLGKEMRRLHAGSTVPIAPVRNVCVSGVGVVVQRHASWETHGCVAAMTWKSLGVK